MSRLPLGMVILAFIAGAVAGCNPNGTYSVSIADGLKPRLTPSDAAAITLAYLDAQTPMLAVPDMHRTPHVAQVWAVRAIDARDLEGCVPPQSSTDIVWVTKGVGDYLNLHVLAWSRGTEQTDDPVAFACEGPGPSGTLVIDDATGAILGVYPYIGTDFPHPTA